MKPPKDLPPHFAFRIPYDPAVSEKEMNRAAEDWAAFEIEAAKQHAERARKFVAAVRQRAEKLREVIGGEHYLDLQRFKQRLRLEALKKMKPPHGLGMTDEELLRTRRRQIQKFFQERGIAAEAVRKAISQGFEGISFPGEANVLGPIRDGLLDLPVFTSVNPWVEFKPPFTGGGEGYREGTWGFSISHTDVTDPTTGHVGITIELTDPDAGDSDFGFMNRSSMVAFWYKPPITGLVAAVIDLQCALARHSLSVRDEYGWSNASVQQRHLLGMRVLKPNDFQATYNLASELHYSGDSPVSIVKRPFPAGSAFQTKELISTSPVAAGKPILIGIGCRSEDIAKANDMEVHSKSSFSWFIPRAQVRILD